MSVRNVRFVIITRNSAGWIRQFLAAYRAIGVEPIYIVDERSDDDTLSMLQHAKAELHIFKFDSHFVEAGPIEYAAQVISTQQAWTLRIDDDEFPSLALLQWLDGSEKDAAPCWALSRREIIRHEDRFAVSRYWTHYHTPSHPTYLNAQVRLYRHLCMSFQRTIHTPGFDQKGNGFAPQDAYFIHLDVLLRDANERLEKLRRYENEVPGSSWKFGSHYLPEIVPTIENDPADLGTSEFDDLIHSLPVKPECDWISLKTSELRALDAERRTFGEDLRRRRAELEVAEERRLQGFASRPIGEFFCTASRAIKPAAVRFPAIARFVDRAHDIGSDLQYRAAARRKQAS